MYHQVSEPLNVLGSALKEATIKDLLKKMIGKIKGAPKELLKEIGIAVSKGKITPMTSDASVKGWVVGIIAGAIISICQAADVQPATVGHALQTGDTTQAVSALDSLFAKIPASADLALIKVDLSKVNQALNDKAFQFDTRIGPTGPVQA
jgi:hypothetical protein